MKLLHITLIVALFLVAGRAIKTNAQTETILYDFANGPSSGSTPEAGLVQGSDGNLYGTTSSGGASTNCFFGGCGTVFQISPSGVYTTLYSFAGAPFDGSSPVAELVQDNDGNFYGTTKDGGTSTNCPVGIGIPPGCGTLFRISSSGSYTNLHSFDSSSGDGTIPLGGLVQDSDGNLYGTTSQGGASGNGTIFRIGLGSGIYTTLYAFAGFPIDGSGPEARLVQGSDGNFYGTTSRGGTNNEGTVFRISPAGSYLSLYSLGNNPTDGIFPEAGLVQGVDGDFYGTTYSDWTNSWGSIFRISPTGPYTTLYYFGNSVVDGLNPRGALVQGSDGKFYGTTSLGGSHGLGALIRISTSGTEESLYSFSNLFEEDEQAPFAGLVQATDGNFYGTTIFGGTNNCLCGTIFKFDAEGCTNALNATSASFPAGGGSKGVRVTAESSNCTWIAVSHNPFIRITFGSSNIGNGKIIYTVAGNTNTTTRSGTMTVAGQTFTVNQAAGGCSFKLSPKAGKIKAAGGAATVKVKPNFNDCAWSAVGNDSFITIIDGASGLGKRAVRYTVTPNTNTTALTGTITIGGETFTITQAGER